jgi:tRNA pseudouridine55 synthase
VPRPQPGLYLAHKPVGPTSFSLVRSVQEALAAAPGRPQAVVHGGTLDPFAHGLLLLLVGQATKLFDHLHAVPKVYEAEIVWGVETDTGDGLGRTTGGDASAARALTPERIAEGALAFTGWQAQVPPPTSAKKIGGEPAYRKVHRGEAVSLPPCQVYLHEVQWRAHDLPGRSLVRLSVRGGYYVRSFARDLGRALGCGAHLRGLHRLAIGPWDDPGPDAGPFLDAPPLRGQALLPWCAWRELADAEVGALRRGGGVPAGLLRPPGWRVPPGFPPPQGPVRGFHLGRLAMLLGERDDQLWCERELHGGL